MNSLLRTVALALLASTLGLGLGVHPAAAISVEDSAGNPDAVAPLADPDTAADNAAQSGGFSIVAPNDQGGSAGGLQWTFGSPSKPAGGGDGQSQ
jgi:hypothetical protein